MARLESMADVDFVREQQEALELIARGAPLGEILELIIRAIERHAPGTRGSVMVLHDGTHVNAPAGPSLPLAYFELIDGMAVGPRAGSCGTAIWFNKRIVVSDIETDPLWDTFRKAALPFGLRACWSTPIHAATGRVVGSFAMYYDHVREPTERDLRLADVASHLAGIAIERASTEDELRRRSAEHAAVAQLGREALESAEFDSFLQRVVDVAEQVLIGARLAIFEGGFDGTPLVLVAPRGRPLPPSPDATVTHVAGRARPWGRIVVQTDHGGPLAADGHDFVRSLAALLASTVERLRAEEKTRHQAVHDPLTGLPNRTLLMELLDHTLERDRRGGGIVATLLLDLDNFKLINDSLGHAAGDELLAALVPRLLGALRESDTVARFGGDEFVIVAADLSSEFDALRMAERLGARIAEPFLVGATPHTVTASIGVAVAHDGDATAGSLLRDADAAMYRAKEAGRGRHQAFDAGMRTRAVKRLQTVHALREALAGDGFSLRFQPIMSLPEGKFVGVETLLRWDGPLGPGEFIPIAEESGLIGRLGAWVLDRACRQAAGPLTSDELWVTVNVSPRQVASPEFVPLVARLIDELGFEPGRLTLEITETALFDDRSNSAQTIAALHELGVGLALDDFGTGFSSLGHLLRFPIQALKIDRSFVAGLPGSESARAIVAGVTTLAHELGKYVVAEGIETQEQLDAVIEFGCDMGQGYLLGRPTHFDALPSQRGQV